MISFGINLAIAMYLIAIIAFINSSNLVTIVICLELLILAVGILLVNLSFHLDDLVGSCISLYLLPLASIIVW
jgi:NADH:ubiquinone oxidoreductase subunit K